VCSGIEAASVAWHPLGWRAVAFSEIETFPSAVLAHHYPDVPNLGDIVATPFLGIGSEAYVAVEMGRRAIGAELKRSYYEQAVRNVASIHEARTADLFAA
jgi:hypothetical protein